MKSFSMFVLLAVLHITWPSVLANVDLHSGLTEDTESLFLFPQSDLSPLESLFPFLPLPVSLWLHSASRGKSLAQ